MVAYGALEMGVSDNRGALNRVSPIVGNSQMYTRISELKFCG